MPDKKNGNTFLVIFIVLLILAALAGGTVAMWYPWTAG